MAKILVVGESCKDIFVYCEAIRLAPDVPVPVLRTIHIDENPGMAANVHRNITSRLKDSSLYTNPEWDRITKTRYMHDKSNHMFFRVDSASDILQVDLGKLDLSSELIVISDYNKGFLTYENIQNLIHDFNGPVFIDTKKKNLEAFNGAYVKINEKEFEESESHAWDMIVTLGAKGAMMKSEMINTTYSTKKVDVVDVCGAGDTFLAALTYQYLVTNSIEDAIKFANKASSITVQHVGNYAPTLEEIK